MIVRDRDDHCAKRIHADHDAAPVVAVRDNATEDTDEEEREPAGDLRPRDQDRRVGEVGSQEGECRDATPSPRNEVVAASQSVLNRPPRRRSTNPRLTTARHFVTLFA